LIDQSRGSWFDARSASPTDRRRLMAKVEGYKRLEDPNYEPDLDESLNRRFADLVLVSEDPDRLVRETPMSKFDIDVTRDGGWWMVHIPKLGGRTPARYPSEVEPLAREYIAVSTGTPIDQVAINWRRCTL
jgi:hypothetical protein